MVRPRYSDSSMPRIKYRFIYDDDGCQMAEGSPVLVNGWKRTRISFDSLGKIALSDFDLEEVMSIVYLPEVVGKPTE